MLAPMQEPRPLAKTLRRAIRPLAWAAAVALAGCAGSPGPANRGPSVEAPVSPYAGGPVAVQCAPFARALSGVSLRGDAADWWAAAKGRYDRTDSPAPGSVLIFQRTQRLASGHASVVSRVVSDRQILVTHANWVRDRVTVDAPVVDVSPENDWSVVRVWWPPTGQLGSTPYPTYGFIVPDRPASPEQLATATPRIIAAARAPR